MDDALVKKSSVFELLKKWADGYGWIEIQTDNAIKELEDLPTVQRWVPMSEKSPPKKKKTYWICTDTGYQCECRWTNVNPIFTSLITDWHWNIFDVPQYSRCVAWMELPDKYVEREIDE